MGSQLKTFRCIWYVDSNAFLRKVDHNSTLKSIPVEIFHTCSSRNQNMKQLFPRQCYFNKTTNYSALICILDLLATSKQSVVIRTAINILAQFQLYGKRETRTPVVEQRKCTSTVLCEVHHQPGTYFHIFNHAAKSIKLSNVRLLEKVTPRSTWKKSAALLYRQFVRRAPEVALRCHY